MQTSSRAGSFSALSIVLGAVLIGSSPILMRLSELAPTATALHRVALAVPALALAMLLWRTDEARQAQPLSSADRLLMMGGGALFALDLICFHWSLAYTSVANSVLFLNFAPVFAGLLAWAMFGERLSAGFLASLALALLGVGLLVGGHAGIDGGRLLGDVLALAAGAFYGAYLLMVNRLRRRTSTLAIMTYTTAACAICLLPVVLASGERLIPVTAAGIGVLLALALLIHVLGQGLIAYALRVLPAASSSTLLLQPLVATVAAWLVFSESLGALQLLGGAILLAGVYMCRRLSPPLNHPEADRAATAAP